jgi:tetratricopeptide (TPR) repeat protein
MRYQEGIVVLKKAADVYPAAADPSFFLGQAYVHTEQYLLAIPYLEVSMVQAPKQWGNYFFLSIAYGKVGKFTEALAMANDGLKKFPGFEKEFYDALGHIYYDKKDLDNSTAYTLKMLNYGAPPKDVYGRIIGRYYAIGEKEKGDAYLAEARSKGIQF